MFGAAQRVCSSSSRSIQTYTHGSIQSINVRKATQNHDTSLGGGYNNDKNWVARRTDGNEIKCGGGRGVSIENAGREMHIYTIHAARPIACLNPNHHNWVLKLTTC